jgi:Ribosomal protein L7/L12 C-terminal domain
MGFRVSSRATTFRTLPIALQTLFEEQASRWIVRTDASGRPLAQGQRPVCACRVRFRSVRPIGFAHTAAEARSEFSVVLFAVGNRKIDVIKVIRDIASLGFNEAKDLVESDRQGRHHRGGGREDQGRAGGGRHDGRAQAIVTIIDLSPETRAALEADDAPLGTI